MRTTLPHQDQLDALATVHRMSVRELLCELARIEERLRDSAAASGFRPAPSHARQVALLRHREGQITHELRVRRRQWRVAVTTPTGPDLDVEADVADLLEQAQVVPDGEDEYPHH